MSIRCDIIKITLFTNKNSNQKINKSNQSIHSIQRTTFFVNASSSLQICISTTSSSILINPCTMSLLRKSSYLGVELKRASSSMVSVLSCYDDEKDDDDRDEEGDENEDVNYEDDKDIYKNVIM